MGVEVAVAVWVRGASCAAVSAGDAEALAVDVALASGSVGEGVTTFSGVRIELLRGLPLKAGPETGGPAAAGRGKGCGE